MKKLWKAVGTLTAAAAAVAGGLALYKRFFAPEEDFEDFEDDLEEEFEEDLDAPERGYVSLTPSPAKEEMSEAAEDGKEPNVKEDTAKEDSTDCEEADTPDESEAAAQAEAAQPAGDVDTIVKEAAESAAEKVRAAMEQASEEA